ncbi:uncharacterized protein LOC121689458 isoform X2 [Alosa sapidissima]|uniref:uncharacterized protein LOC121689458 isoform X2 n=1 Tax=Alosa sapidissima TaxID=34773 RepID=UPI001C0A028A|nr:uncharacterized protein LOC121689458 isoform X2 [Alosa sapidissima]
MIVGWFSAHGWKIQHALADLHQCQLVSCVVHQKIPQQRLFFLAVLGSLMSCGHTADIPTAVLIVQPQNLVSTGQNVTLICVIEPGGDWRYKWYKDISNLFSKTMHNNITISMSAANEALYWCQGDGSPNFTSSPSNSVYLIERAAEGIHRCQGEGSSNLTSSSNSVCITGRGQQSNQCAVGVVTGVVLGSLFTAFLFKICPYCFLKLRALGVAPRAQSTAPSSGQAERSTHRDQNLAGVNHHVYETIVDDCTEDEARGPKTVYVKLEKPKSTTSYEARGPQTVYVKLAPPRTAAQCRAASLLPTHFQVD